MNPRRLRRAINRHPVPTAAVVLAAVAAAVWLAARDELDRRRPPEEPAEARAFYTDDDGETWFADDGERITPFDHGGRPAVIAHVYSCDGGKTRFVGYLEKLPDDARQRFAAATSRPADGIDPDEVGAVVGTLVKRKGDAEWVNSSQREQYRQVTEVHCPDGGGGTPLPVRP